MFYFVEAAVVLGGICSGSVGVIQKAICPLLCKHKQGALYEAIKNFAFSSSVHFNFVNLQVQVKPVSWLCFHKVVYSLHKTEHSLHKIEYRLHEIE